MPGNEFSALASALVDVLRAFEIASRHLNPLSIPRLRVVVLEKAAELQRARGKYLEASPHETDPPSRLLLEACGHGLKAAGLFGDGEDMQQAFLSVLRSFRRFCRAQEDLFMLRDGSPEVDGYFLEPGAEIPRPASGGDETGIHHSHAGDDPYARGGYSLYVPETYDPGRAWPLVVALHGGYGHGRDFLWTWLREARSRGFVLMAPTSTGRTWSIGRIGDDAGPLRGHIDEVCSRFAIERGKILLTGMSDGGTYSLGLGLTGQSPATAIAPVSCVLPFTDLEHARTLRICWVHGAQDWMFPLARAEQGCRALSKAGADVRLRVIPDLSHAYPREENDVILQWFDPSLKGPGS